MNQDLLNISAIENFLHSVLYKKVSDKLFFGGLPSTISSSWTDMVLVDMSNSITDQGAFGSGTISILLYAAKNKADGTKNSPVLSALAKNLNVALKSYNRTNYSIKRVGVVSDYDTVRKLYYDAVILQLIVA